MVLLKFWEELSLRTMPGRMFVPEAYSVAMKNAREKMRVYNDRILQVEKACFVPLIYTTTGGMGPLHERTHKRIAQLVVDGRNEKYAEVMSHMRTKLRFSFLRIILVAIRGARGRRSRPWEEKKLPVISFNLIPYANTYEGY